MSQKVVESWEELLEDNDAETALAEVTVGTRTFRLGSLSGIDLLKWFEQQNDPELKKTNGLWLVAKSLINSAGVRIGKLDDITALRAKQPKVVRKLVDAALELNELTAKKEVEAKNDKQEGPSSNSGTPSPVTSAA